MNTEGDREEFHTPPKVSFEEAWQFIVKVGLAAHRYGSTAAHLESFLVGLSKEFGYVGAFRSTPSEIVFGLREKADSPQRLELVKTPAPGVDLDKLARLGDLLNELKAGTITLADCPARLDAIDRVPPPWGKFASMLGYAFSGMGLAPLLGGGLSDALYSALLGIVVYGVVLLSARLGACRVNVAAVLVCVRRGRSGHRREALGAGAQSRRGDPLSGRDHPSGIHDQSRSRRAGDASHRIGCGQSDERPDLPVQTGCGRMAWRRRRRRGRAPGSRGAGELRSIRSGCGCSFPRSLPGCASLSKPHAGICPGRPWFVGLPTWESWQEIHSSTATLEIWLGTIIAVVVANLWARKTGRPGAIVLIPAIVFMVGGTHRVSWPGHHGARRATDGGAAISPDVRRGDDHSRRNSDRLHHRPTGTRAVNESGFS